MAANPITVARTPTEKRGPAERRSRYCQRSARSSRSAPSHHERERQQVQAPALGISASEKSARDRWQHHASRPTPAWPTASHRRRVAPCEQVHHASAPELYYIGCAQVDASQQLPPRLKSRQRSVRWSAHVHSPRRLPWHARPRNTLRRTDPFPPRQGPRHLRGRRRPADRRHRPDLGVRLRPGHRHPGQGRGPQPALGVLVRHDGRHRPEPRARHRPRTTSRRRCGATADVLRGRSMLVRQHPAAGHRVRRARLPVRVGLEGIPEDRARCAASAARRPARIGSAARADLHARPPRPRAATTSTSPKPRPAKSSAARALPKSRDLSLAGLQPGRPPRRRPRHHRRRHEIRVRRDGCAGPGRAADPDRRSADAGLVALLAGRRSTRPGGRQPSFDKQFVRDYLEKIGWNKQPPAPALPPDVVAKTREKYVDAFRQLTGTELV